MPTAFRLPDVGEGLTEADIVNWLVAVGDEIKVNDPIVEVETAKSVVELPSPYAGTVTALLVEPGQTVEVGSPIIEFETADAAPEQPRDDISDEVSETAATLVGYGASTNRSRRSLRRRGSTKTASATVATLNGNGASPQAEAPTKSVTKLAKPPVRKLAKDLGIDLYDVPASGDIGQVTRDDVLAFADTPAQQPTEQGPKRPAAAASTPEASEVIPLKGVRKATAQAMVSSAFTAPHITEFLDVDVTKTMALVRQLRAQDVAPEGVKITPLTVLSKAVCWAASRTPELNARLDEDQIVLQRHVNLGIAAATDRGLIVPNIKNADRLGLVGLATELGQLTSTARNGKTSPIDQTGGTITITNVGVFGVDSGTPILNPGESAIVAFGQIRKRPWVVEEELAVRDVTTLSVSADHRVVDGAEVSRFLADIGAALENPQSMLL